MEKDHRDEVRERVEKAKGPEAVAARAEKLKRMLRKRLTGFLRK